MTKKIMITGASNGARGVEKRNIFTQLDVWEKLLTEETGFVAKRSNFDKETYMPNWDLGKPDILAVVHDPWKGWGGATFYPVLYQIWEALERDIPIVHILSNITFDEVTRSYASAYHKPGELFDFAKRMKFKNRKFIADEADKLEVALDWLVEFEWTFSFCNLINQSHEDKVHEATPLNLGKVIGINSTQMLIDHYQEEFSSLGWRSQEERESVWFRPSFKPLKANKAWKQQLGRLNWEVEDSGRRKATHGILNQNQVIERLGETSGSFFGEFRQQEIGWWRARQVTGPMLGNVFVPCEAEAKLLGEPFQVTMEQVENMSFEERDELAANQALKSAELSQTPDEIKDILTYVLNGIVHSW